MERVGLYEVPTAFVNPYIQAPKYYAPVVRNTIGHASLTLTTSIQGTHRICRIDSISSQKASKTHSTKPQSTHTQSNQHRSYCPALVGGKCYRKTLL